MLKNVQFILIGPSIRAAVRHVVKESNLELANVKVVSVRSPLQAI